MLHFFLQIDLLSTIGGQGPSNIVKGIMTNLITDDLARKYSLKGQRGKASFSSLKQVVAAITSK
jgi:hypothetical protein